MYTMADNSYQTLDVANTNTKSHTMSVWAA